MGLSYNSSVTVKLKGTFDFPVEPEFEQFMLTFMSGSVWGGVVDLTDSLGFRLPSKEELEAQGGGNIRIRYEVPQRLNAGISVQVTPSWKYNFDIKWTDWSKFSNIDVQFDRDVPLLAFGNLVDVTGTGGARGIKPNAVTYRLGLKDVTYWSMGTEYQWTDNFSLRAGIQERPSAVDPSRLLILSPENTGLDIIRGTITH